jgi:hypothetical protein
VATLAVKRVSRILRPRLRLDRSEKLTQSYSSLDLKLSEVLQYLSYRFSLRVGTTSRTHFMSAAKMSLDDFQRKNRVESRQTREVRLEASRISCYRTK